MPRMDLDSLSSWMQTCWGCTPFSSLSGSGMLASALASGDKPFTLGAGVSSMGAVTSLVNRRCMETRSHLQHAMQQSATTRVATKMRSTRSVAKGRHCRWCAAGSTSQFQIAPCTSRSTQRTEFASCGSTIPAVMVLSAEQHSRCQVTSQALSAYRYTEGLHTVGP